MMENIRNLLMSRFGYSVQDVDLLSRDLEQLDSTLVPILAKWVSDGTCSDATEYSGYSIDSLCSRFDMNFIAALLTLDWIIKEPEKALTAIKNGVE